MRQAMEEAGIEDIESRHIVIPWNPEQREKAYEEMLPFFKKQTALFFHRITMHLKHPTFCRTGE